MKQEELTDWRDRLNEIHNEMQVQVDLAWDRIITDDAISLTPFHMNAEKREMVRRGRHVLHLIESGIDNLDLILELNS